MPSYHDKTELMTKEFLVESFENLSTISEEITKLEKNPGDTELLNDVYRKVHTVKGSANFLHFNHLQEITHSAESLLDLVREGLLEINSEVVDALLASMDAVTEILKEIEKDGKEPDKKFGEVQESLLGAIENSTKSPGNHLVKESNIVEPLLKEIESKAEIESVFKDNIANETKANKTPEEEKTAIINDNSQDINAFNNQKQNNQPSNTEKEVPMSTQTETKGNGSSDKKLSDAVVRVDVNLLDKMMNVVGELVLNRNQILQFSNSREIPELHRLSQQLDIITSELQQDVMTTRMQPIGSILNKFERIVRDMAKETKKKINLKIEGKDTELDRTLLEAIKDLTLPRKTDPPLKLVL